MALTKDSAHRKDLTTGIASMEHRHFATIATIIREMPGYPTGDARDDITSEESRKVALMFSNRLRTTNPNFDRRRFLLACGVEA